MTIKTFKSELLSLTIEIDHDKCTGCGNCVTECPSEVFELLDEKSVCITIDDCVECCACVDGCPEKAIKHSSCLD
jgi:NAD-dependent dihydropyrimidine dehydrogenase PreA subunit